ncbi:MULTISPECIES: TetR/AcrR family transcriptional regulator [unclassified Nocardia]|uniref:TetR/AcrR family transcriptional regulator n=1 Tax=unclassified Nocardia TaxID=2637762 RepID=UPI0033A2D307
MTTGPRTDRIAEIPTPTGREAVRAAVIEHAAELFAERGPAATSVRDIAERAGVNHGLVFRHFGAKENLVAAVLDHLGDLHGPATDLSGTGPVDPATRLHLTVLARCLLDGYPVGRLQQRFPIMAALVDRAAAAGADDRSAALAAANAAALLVGWEMFGPFLRAATGLQDVPDAELRRDATARATRILDGDA